MKRIFIWLTVLLIIFTLTIMTIGCKEEAVEETSEQISAEETTEEEPEEAVEEEVLEQINITL